MVSGSPPYMAPEQLTQGAFGPGSDVFSLAAILHYAATTSGPYGRGGAQEQYARALAVGPVLDAALPDALADAVRRCFVTDPAARPAAGELARSLEAHPGERPSPGWLPENIPLLHEHLRNTFGSGTGCATATCCSSRGTQPAV